MAGFHATLPALLLSAGILAVLAADLFARGRHPLVLAWIARVACLAAAVAAWRAPHAIALAQGLAEPRDEVFFGALRMDRFAVVFTTFCAITGFVSISATLRGEGNRRPGAEFHVLVLGAVLGMAVLSAAVDLVTLYLAFETVSITGYVLVGMRRADRLANEASLKYVLFGAVSSGLMLYGLSLLFGLAGGTSLASLATAVHNGAASQPIFVAATVLVFAGFAFKVSAVPFHFWAPDVYQGAPAAVAGFLSVASKAAGFAGLVRVAQAMGTTGEVAADAATGFLPATGPMSIVLAVSAVLTMTVGNLAAVRQSEIKRLLAYSSIAHAGYMLMALAVWSTRGIEAVVFYLVTYLFMNLAAFLIAGIVIRETGSGDLDNLRGLGFRNPWLAGALAIVLFSLTGLPPTFGFVGKWVVFLAVFESGYTWLAVVGLLNGAVSLYYYAKVLRSMYLEEETGRLPRLRTTFADGLLTAVLVVPVLAFFVWWEPLYRTVQVTVPALGERP